MEKVKFAIVGCGSVSWNRYWPRIPDITKGQLVATCDASAERAKKPADMYKVPYFTDLDKMLAETDFDLLVNLTNDQMHYGVNLKGLQAGKHIYTQKPMTVTVEQATELIDEAAKRKLKIAAEEAAPLFLMYRTIRHLLEEGVIGKVVWARATCTHWGPGTIDNWPTDPAWFYAKGGGPLRDVGIERLHALTYLLGPCKRVSAMSGINQPEVVVRGGPNKGKLIKVEEDDLTLLTLDFGQSTFAMLDAAWVNQKATLTPYMEIYGQKGVITVMKGASREPGQRDFDVRLFRDEPGLGVRGWEQIEAIPPLTPEPSIAITGLIHAIDCILDDKKPEISGERARHCIEIMEKCYLSARTGSAQKIEYTF